MDSQKKNSAPLDVIARLDQLSKTWLILDGFDVWDLKKGKRQEGKTVYVCLIRFTDNWARGEGESVTEAVSNAVAFAKSQRWTSERLGWE